MRIMSVFTSFGGLEKTGGVAQTIMMSNIPKVDDPCNTTPRAPPLEREYHRIHTGNCFEAMGMQGRLCDRWATQTTTYGPAKQ